MKAAEIVTLKDIASIEANAKSRFYSATEKEIEQVLTRDVFFVMTHDLLGPLDLQKVNGKAVSKRGRIHGVTDNERLVRVD
ncbi:MAG: hypothetical protein ACQES4_01395 [Bacillota bacterium]